MNALNRAPHCSAARETELAILELDNATEAGAEHPRSYAEAMARAFDHLAVVNEIARQFPAVETVELP